MIDPFYTIYQKDQWATVQAYDNVIRELHKRRNRFLDKKDKASAQRCWQELSELQEKRDKLALKMVRDREDFSAAMIKVFMLANMTYAKAIEFQELVVNRTGSKDTALAEDVGIMLKACQAIALMVDSVGHDKQVNALSDIIDSLEDRFKETIDPVLDGEIEAFRKSNQFKLF